MDDSERPPWRMTLCEAQVLTDLKALGAALKKPDAPEALLCVLINARKGGNPLATIRNLAEHGFILRNREKKTCSRTTKQIPVTSLVGATPNPLPNGGVARLVRLWKAGRRDLTVDDLKEPKDERVARGLPLHGEG